MELRGIYPALLSTFRDDFSFDFDNLRKLVRMLVKRNVHGFYAGGSSSELFALTLEERKKAVEITREEADGKPVIVHVGAMNPEDAKALARHAGECGCQAISAIPPFYCKYTWAETATYYRGLMEASGLKMFLYNIPAFTGVSLSTAGYKELLETGMVAGVKHTCHNLYELERLKNAYPEGIVLSGYDEIFSASQLMGAEGCIGTSVNAFPEYYQKIDGYLKKGDNGSARKVQTEMNNLLEVFMEVNFFAAVKHIVSFQGVCTGNCRPPFLPLTPEQKMRLEEAYLRCEKNMASL